MRLHHPAGSGDIQGGDGSLFKIFELAALTCLSLSLLFFVYFSLILSLACHSFLPYYSLFLFLSLNDGERVVVGRSYPPDPASSAAARQPHYPANRAAEQRHRLCVAHVYGDSSFSSSLGSFFLSRSLVLTSSLCLPLVLSLSFASSLSI